MLVHDFTPGMSWNWALRHRCIFCNINNYGFRLNTTFHHTHLRMFSSTLEEGGRFDQELSYLFSESIKNSSSVEVSKNFLILLLQIFLLFWASFTDFSLFIKMYFDGVKIKFIKIKLSLILSKGIKELFWEIFSVFGLVFPISS